MDKLSSTFYSDACFMAEQTSQVALKALIIFYKKRNVGEHSIQELVRISSEYDKRFPKRVEYPFGQGRGKCLAREVSLPEASKMRGRDFTSLQSVIVSQ